LDIGLGKEAPTVSVPGINIGETAVADPSQEGIFISAGDFAGLSDEIIGLVVDRDRHWLNPLRLKIVRR
jgi:hypothetical protein